MTIQMKATERYFIMIAVKFFNILQNRTIYYFELFRIIKELNGYKILLIDFLPFSLWN